MISNEILLQLVPEDDPKDEFPADQRLFRRDFEEPARRIGIWSAFLRHRISRDISEGGFLEQLVQTSGFVATGIFRAPFENPGIEYSGFKQVAGYQFGAMLMRSKYHPESESPYISDVVMNFGAYRAPVMQCIAEFRKHGNSSDGYVAATFTDDNGDRGGLTAGHVVENYQRGQRVPVWCSDCSDEAKLKRLSPGQLDSAVVSFPCGGPYSSGNGNVRAAIEGEHVEAHFGATGKERCTVMSALQTSSQIKSAAMPEQFLIDKHGYPGDSGSFVSGEDSYDDARDLIGIYLGKTKCVDEHQKSYNYGYA